MEGQFLGWDKDNNLLTTVSDPRFCDLELNEAEVTSAP
jgi:hypothetical protein